MSHADSFLLRDHDWATAVGLVLLMATVLGIASNQTSRWFATDSALRVHPISAAASEMVTIARLAAPHHANYPAVLTVPFAITRTQRMMVARMKHRPEAAALHDQTGKGATPRILTGLAILGASQSSNQ